uniref:Zgc:153911 n=1 Tax=Denticeps clupeoides TaxID=299321 RepID=A0AAY3ZYQ5_9TELE
MILSSFASRVFLLCSSLLGVRGYSNFEIIVPSTTQTAFFGQPVVLPCTFPVGPTWTLDSTVITWQRGQEVVHSFYHMRNQLSQQSSHYTNRTSLYLSEIAKGNASLRLDNATLGDIGQYACSVSTNVGSQKKSFPLKVAAWYPEPELQISTSAGSAVVLLTTEGGFPSPTLQWFNSSSVEDVTNKTVTNITQDKDSGLYQVTSSLQLHWPSNSTLIFILRNQELQQEVRRSIRLLSDFGDEVCSSRNRNFVLWPILCVSVTLLTLGLWLLFHRRQKTLNCELHRQNCLELISTS